MHEATPPPSGARPATIDGRVGLFWRLAIAAAAAAAAGIGVERALGEVIPTFGTRALVSALTAAALVGVALWQLIVVPLSRSRADLHERYEAALAEALADPLTGLGNHRAFQEELDRQVEAAQRYEVPLALVIIDLDEFKQVNDSGGHAEGDRTLAYFGELLGGSVRRADRSFRIGGDEFAILLPHTDAEGARIVVRRLLAGALQPLVRRDGQPRSPISFSAGVSAVPELAASRAQLYSQADAALYQAKHAGRTDVVVFDPAAAPDAAELAGSGAEVAEVIARGQLRPVFQPIVDLASGDVLGMEGLIRPVPPAPFVDPGGLFRAARASGHLVALDLACFETIVAGAAGLEDGPFLSINLSPATVQSQDFSANTLVGILVRHGVAPERVVIELTEREEIDDLDKVRARLEACRASGLRLAADDVGAGNSGLRLLSEVRFDIIKVDLDLVRRSASSAASSAVIESVVSLAARTGALVVGEGIEEPAQQARLVALGVLAGQGYLLGRPGPLPPPRELASAGAAIPSLAAPPVAAPTGGRGTGLPLAGADGDDAGSLNSWRQSIGLPVA